MKWLWTWIAFEKWYDFWCRFAAWVEDVGAWIEDVGARLYARWSKSLEKSRTFRREAEADEAVRRARREAREQFDN